jgi:hypothetical protein
MKKISLLLCVILCYLAVIPKTTSGSEVSLKHVPSLKPKLSPDPFTKLYSAKKTYRNAKGKLFTVYELIGLSGYVTNGNVKTASLYVHFYSDLAHTQPLALTGTYDITVTITVSTTPAMDGYPSSIGADFVATPNNESSSFLGTVDVRDFVPDNNSPTYTTYDYTYYL